MKRNDFATFLVYVLMFALALCVGLFAIRPIMMDYSAKLPMHFVLLVVLSLLAGILVNGLLLEAGHLLGAKIGGYEILSCVVLMFGVKKKNGKLRFGVYGYDGLTGETKVAPKDEEKSSLGAYAFLPILLYVLEAIILMSLNAFAEGQLKTSPDLAWLQVFSLTVLAVGGMVFLYDIFPFRLDAMNDGYLFLLLSKPGNKVAYNYYLNVEKARFLNLPAPDRRAFDDITDFTAYLNYFAIYDLVAKGDFDGASALLDRVATAEKGVAANSRYEAACFKLSLLLASSKTTVGKAYYAEFTDDQKKFISDLGSVPALRAYLLISACIEDSEAEANYALDKAEKLLAALGKEEETFFQAEKALLQYDKDFVAKLHPSWSLYPLPWEEKKGEDAESKEEGEAPAKSEPEPKQEGEDPEPDGEQ